MRKTGIRYSRPVSACPVSYAVEDYAEMFRFRVVGTGARVPIHDIDLEGHVMRGNDNIIGREFREHGKDNCGEVKYYRVCVSDPNHYHAVTENCFCAYCTECYTNWVNRASGRIVDKLSALYRSLDIDGGFAACLQDEEIKAAYDRVNKVRSYPFRHWVLSFPCDYKPCKGDIFQILEIFKQYPLYGCAVYHPFRLTAAGVDKCHYYRSLNPDYKGGNWDIWHKEELYKDDDSYYLSPHLHLVLAGFIPNDLEELLRSKGFVLKMVRVVGKPTIESCYGSVLALLRYLLSHAAYIGSRSAPYRYLSLGRFIKYRKFVEPCEPDLITCPFCGSPMKNVGGQFDGAIAVSNQVSKITYYLRIQRDKHIFISLASVERYKIMKRKLDSIMERVKSYSKVYEGGLFAYT